MRHTPKNRQFQSTLLQEERPDDTISIQKCIKISIHAPTRGATLLLSFGLGHFIFQSTLLQEERHLLAKLMPMLWVISIHAPTRGATPFPETSFAPALFQSTLLQEERRHLRHVHIRTIPHFNPRSYKRSDKLWGTPQIL